MQINWEALGAIGEIGGAIAIIVTLVYLARQIRQSNRIAIASTEISVRESFNLVNQSIFTETGTAELLVKAADSNAELNEVDSLKLYHLILRGLNQWHSVESAFANGMVPAETHSVIFDDMRAFLETYPACRLICRQAIDNYPSMGSSEVFRHMDKLLQSYD